LVIVDMLMPVMGWLDMLLNLTREFLHARVIAFSGAGGEQSVLDVAKLLGARQTLQKPFSMPQLLDAVRYELANQRHFPSVLSLSSFPHWITQRSSLPSLVIAGIIATRDWIA
jgi:DNA-binding NarL/FixJ family response regulator